MAALVIVHGKRGHHYVLAQVIDGVLEVMAHHRSAVYNIIPLGWGCIEYPSPYVTAGGKKRREGTTGAQYSVG